MSKKKLDLAFCMDCTGSMAKYIETAQKSIRYVVDEIVAKEKVDVRLALVQYRDHKPEDTTFVTKVMNFTSEVSEMKAALDNCSADGGGDTPEAIADALNDVLNLSWQPDVIKVCILIADAPPHGLLRDGDHFPEGCPEGHDPVVISKSLAKNDITLYVIGCEPSINASVDWFRSIAFTTGGQYISLDKADMLPDVIISETQEEICLSQLYSRVLDNITAAKQAVGGAAATAEDISQSVHQSLLTEGVKTKQLYYNDKAVGGSVSRQVQQLSSINSITEARDSLELYQRSSTAAEATPKKDDAADSKPSITAKSTEVKDGSGPGSFVLVEQDVDYEQVQRMVQKISFKTE